MQRVYEETVTPRYNRPEQEVPILTPALEKSHIDAVASFHIAGLERIGIRVLRRGDFNEVLYRSLSKKAQKQLRELIALRQGIVEEEPSFWLREFLREDDFDWKAAAAVEDDLTKFGRPSRRTEKMIGRRWPSGDPLTRLSVAVTKKLSRARLVLWLAKRRRSGRKPQSRPGDEREQLLHQAAYLMQSRRGVYVPAIFCPDVETAFYCYMLFSFTGRGLGICLECGEIFQKTRTDVLYCCPSHAEAYRIRRWRERKKKEREGKTK